MAGVPPNEPHNGLSAAHCTEKEIKNAYDRGKLCRQSPRNDQAPAQLAQGLDLHHALMSLATYLQIIRHHW